MGQLLITIKEGKIEMEVDGVKGAQCLELTQALEQITGKVENRTLKPDFYNTTKIKQLINALIEK